MFFWDTVYNFEFNVFRNYYGESCPELRGIVTDIKDLRYDLQ